MDIFVGRGGNQMIPLTNKEIAPLHCLIECEEENVYKVTPTSVMPTFIEGERIFETTYVDGETTVSLGKGNDYRISDLRQHIDASDFSDWGIVSRHIPDAVSAEAFNSVAVWEYPVNDGELNEFLWNNVATCQANYLIDCGKLRNAQELLYEAGDSLYAMQDGSPKLKAAYAALLVVLGKLYKAAGREDMAAQALDGARRVFASGSECSEEVTLLLNSLSQD